MGFLESKEQKKVSDIKPTQTINTQNQSSYNREDPYSRARREEIASSVYSQQRVNSNRQVKIDSGNSRYAANPYAQPVYERRNKPTNGLQTNIFSASAVQKPVPSGQNWMQSGQYSAQGISRSRVMPDRTEIEKYSTLLQQKRRQSQFQQYQHKRQQEEKRAEREEEKKRRERVEEDRRKRGERDQNKKKEIEEEERRRLALYQRPNKSSCLTYQNQKIEEKSSRRQKTRQNERRQKDQFLQQQKNRQENEPRFPDRQNQRKQKDNETNFDQNQKYNYLYTFGSLKNQLYALNIDTPTFQHPACSPILESELKRMETCDFFFHYFNDCEHDQHGPKYRKFLRKVSLRFQCSNNECRFFRRTNKRKSWFSIYGLVFITYYFGLSSREQYNEDYAALFSNRLGPNKKYFLHYCIRLYRQECKDCKEFCEGEICEPQMRVVSKMFCFCVAKVLSTESDPTTKPFRNRKADQIEYVPPIESTHIKELCEACQNGKCKIIKKVKYHY